MATKKYADLTTLAELVSKVKALISGISLSTLSGVLPLSKGGTGATDATTALTNLGAAASNHTHTAASIGAATANHTHTAASIGAAPSSHTHALNDMSGTLSVTKGGTGATSAAAARTALGAASVALYQVTVATGWTSASTGYTKTVTVSGILSTDVPVVGVVLSSDASAAQLQGKAFACVNRITTATNSITLYAYSSAPTTSFTIQLLTVRGF